MQLGVIADDVTGGTDLASTVKQAGLSVLQTMGQPRSTLPPSDVVVVSLKIRTAPSSEAVAAAGAAARYLQRAGARQIYFKYCSTFDSTDAGNIGPVADHLFEMLGGVYTVATPAYPSLGRTVYLGHLFVGGRLLSESSMRDHPLTPMTDPDLVRVLGRQSANGVDSIGLSTVEAGVEAVRDRCVERAESGRRMLVADAVLDRHLDTLGAAFADLPLVTGAAGLGRSLARQMTSMAADPLEGRGADRLSGPVAILSGSCSVATRGQVQLAREAVPSRELTPLDVTDERALAAVVDWAVTQITQVQQGRVLVSSTADPASVRSFQEVLGREGAATAVESAFKVLARALADAGVRTFVVAGGETSGAVMDALGIRAVGFGEEIAPGVPWTASVDPEGFHLALKSGNFGAPDFFLRALGLRGGA